MDLVPRSWLVSGLSSTVCTLQLHRAKYHCGSMPRFPIGDSVNVHSDDGAAVCTPHTSRIDPVIVHRLEFSFHG